jgi:hypothetical protein
MASVAQGKTTPMSINKLRFALLIVCLVALALGAMVLPGSHLLFDGAVVAAAVLTLYLTRGRSSVAAEAKPSKTRSLAGLSAFSPFGKSKISEVLLSVEALRGELGAHKQLSAAQQQLSAALTDKVEQFEALRRAMYLELEQRLSSVEVNQETELARLRQTRDRHEQSMSKLTASIDAHKRELANLSEVLQAPVAELAPMTPVELPQPAASSY